MGGDPFVMAETFKEVQACRKAGIMINTFMLASDYYLVDFVKQMTAMTNGKAYFANPGNFVTVRLNRFPAPSHSSGSLNHLPIRSYCSCS